MKQNESISSEPLKFKREHFIRIDIDLYHYYYSFGVPGFELCLEPCAAGFDVAIYTDNDGIPQYDKSAIEPKRCTHTGDYVTVEALFGDRSDEDWKKALEIADEMLGRYMEDRQKLAELLARKIEVKGNDLISGDEIMSLRSRTKFITMKEALRSTMEMGIVLIIPMCLKSGFCASLITIENQPDPKPLDILSVAKCGSKCGGKCGFMLPDPADADHIAQAVLGKGYQPIVGLMAKNMLHYWKRRD